MSVDADALARLRCSAALLACTPTLSVRLRWHDRTILEVMRPPHPERDHAVLPPCWFRALLGDVVRGGAPQDPLARERVERLLGCAVDHGVRGGTTLLPGDVVRFEVGDAWMHLLAVAAPVADVGPIARPGGDDVERDVDDPIRALGLHAADDLGVTVLSLGTHQDLVHSGEAAEVLRDVAMRVAVHRLERHLAAVAAHPARRDGDRP